MVPLHPKTLMKKRKQKEGLESSERKQRVDCGEEALRWNNKEGLVPPDKQTIREKFHDESKDLRED